MPSDHGFRLADESEEVPIEGRLDNTVVKLQDQHELIVGAKLLRDQLARLNFIVIEPLFVLDQVLCILLDFVSVEVLSRDHPNVAAEDVDRLFDHIGVLLVNWLVEVVQPGVRLEAHQANDVVASHQEHNVAIRLLRLFETLLLYHLGVIHEADKLPLSKVDDSLRHVLRHVDDRDFFVFRREGLVGE